MIVFGIHARWMTSTPSLAWRQLSSYVIEDEGLGVRVTKANTQVKKTTKKNALRYEVMGENFAKQMSPPASTALRPSLAGIVRIKRTALLATVSRISQHMHKDSTLMVTKATFPFLLSLPVSEFL